MPTVDAEIAFDALEIIPVERVEPRHLHRRAIEIATAMGWARTYDAEHCALAELVDGVLLTCDERLRRGADGRLPYVMTPDEFLAAL